MNATLTALIIPVITLFVELAKQLGMPSKFALLLVLTLSCSYTFFAYWSADMLTLVLTIFIQAAGAVGLYEAKKTLVPPAR